VIDVPRAGDLHLRVPVSVVIVARDAAAHIAACVRSTTWASETLVVEGGSSDDTRLIALAEGATVFTHPFSSIGRQRNLAVERASHEWVLVLDAEERCTPELATEVGALLNRALPGAPVLAAGTPVEAFAVPRRSRLGARALRGGRWAPDAPVRLFRRRLRFDELPGADRLDTEGAPVAQLDSTLVREVDVAHEAVAERIAHAARDWALRESARGERASALSLPLRAIAQFFSSYVVRGGWRDGDVGLALAFLDATETAMRWSQLWALGRRDDARDPTARAGRVRDARAATGPRASR
jgi:(heptosyl)LPS beta-1,4-glucosyltransferase